MSESAVILEGEVARRFNPVDKLRATNQDSSVSDWVPSDTLDLGSLMASKNTLYLANIDDDCDAYEEVEVDVSEELEDGDYKKITGKGNDGNDYAVGLDENGNLTKEMIPAAIHIVVPPRKLKYEEGETLDFTGIHVYLMDGNNKRYTDSSYPTGEIPFGELIFPVTIAESDTPSQTYPDYKDSGTVVVTSVGSISAAIHEAMGFYSGGWDDEGGCIAQIMSDISQYEGTNPAIVSVYNGHGNFEGWSPLSVMVITSIHIGDRINLGRQYVSVEYTTRGKANAGEVMKITDMKVASSNSIAYIGTKDGEVSTLNATPSEGGDQEVPVQWMRSDGEILQDTFAIEIVSEEQPVPAPEPDPWGGYADVSWGGHHYNFNRRLVPPVQYSNGYCWRQQASEYIAEYTVEQAASMGWLILIR